MAYHKSDTVTNVRTCSP